MKNSNDVIFVHIPRTAGTSIATALGSYKKQHQHFFARKHIALRPDWGTCFKFSFVRNPWDRVVSLFTYQTNGSGSFKDWLLDIVNRDGLPLNRKNNWKATPKMASTGGSNLTWKNQCDWLTNYKGEICMDFIGRYEQIEQDFIRLCDIVGSQVKLPHLRKTSHPEYTSYYDDETKKIVADWHKPDIEAFGYKFGPKITFL